MQNDKTMTDITIGIATWNGAHLLKDCLHSIVQNVKGVSYDVVVVDNGSIDETDDVMKDYPDFIYIKNEVNEGVAKARNKAFARANSRYTILLDVDTIIHPNAFETLVEVMDNNPKYGIGGPKLLNPDGTLQLSSRTFQTPLTVLFRGTPLGNWFPSSPFVKDHLMTDWDHSTTQSVDWLMGACHIIRKEVYQEIGGLDEGFFYLYEDVEYCWRAMQKGWLTCLIPESEITHIYQRKSAAGFNAMTVKHIKSILRFFRIRYIGAYK